MLPLAPHGLHSCAHFPSKSAFPGVWLAFSRLPLLTPVGASCNAPECEFAVSKQAVVGFRYSRPRVANLPLGLDSKSRANIRGDTNLRCFRQYRERRVSPEIHARCMPHSQIHSERFDSNRARANQQNEIVALFTRALRTLARPVYSVATRVCF